ncbi:MAG: RNA polymerase sigma factor [Ilumatobacteraceae bacterium]
MDAAVVRGFAAGDPQAVGEVYATFGRLVFAVANRILGNRSLAEEATQQTFVNAWRASASFDVDRDLGPWLATIARRAAIDIHRREARRRVTPLDDASPADSSLIALPPSVDQMYHVWQVREAIDALGADEREVVRLQHLEQLTHAEIAVRLAVPLGTVKSRSHRAHRLLAARLGHLRQESAGRALGPQR